MKSSPESVIVRQRKLNELSDITDKMLSSEWVICQGNLRLIASQVGHMSMMVAEHFVTDNIEIMANIAEQTVAIHQNRNVISKLVEFLHTNAHKVISATLYMEVTPLVLKSACSDGAVSADDCGNQELQDLITQQMRECVMKFYEYMDKTLGVHANMVKQTRHVRHRSASHFFENLNISRYAQFSKRRAQRKRADSDSSMSSSSSMDITDTEDTNNDSKTDLVSMLCDVESGDGTAVVVDEQQHSTTDATDGTDEKNETDTSLHSLVFSEMSVARVRDTQLMGFNFQPSASPDAVCKKTSSDTCVTKHVADQYEAQLLKHLANTDVRRRSCPVCSERWRPMLVMNCCGGKQEICVNCLITWAYNNSERGSRRFFQCPFCRHELLLFGLTSTDTGPSAVIN